LPTGGKMANFKNLILLPIGSSDLQTTEGKKITFQNTREAKTADINNYKLPIQQPFLNCLKEKAILSSNPEIFLLATLQKPQHPQDTYFNAILIKKILQNQYPNVPIHIRKITKNPSDYNLMLKFFSKFKKGLRLFWLRKHKHWGNHHVYINLTSSTPAIQISLLHLFPYANFYYTNLQGQVRKINFSWPEGEDNMDNTELILL
jgi:hypothetical protein